MGVRRLGSSLLALVASIAGCGEAARVGGEYEELAQGVCSDSPEVRVLVERRSELVSALALDDERVYFGTGDALWMAWKHGGGSERLAGGRPRGIAVDEDDVYWSTADGVHRLSKRGGEQPTRLIPADDAGGLVLDERRVYFTRSGSDTVDAIDKDGSGGSTFFVPDAYTISGRLARADRELIVLGLDADALDVLLAIDTESGQVREVGRPGPGLGSFTADADAAYWGVFDDLHTVALEGGGEATVIASAQGRLGKIGTDADRLVWTDAWYDQAAACHHARFHCFAKADGETVEIGDFTAEVTAMVVDEQGVYWVSEVGTGQASILMLAW